MKMNDFICTKFLENVKCLDKHYSLGEISYNAPAKKITDNDHVCFPY